MQWQSGRPVGGAPPSVFGAQMPDSNRFGCDWRSWLEQQFVRHAALVRAVIWNRLGRGRDPHQVEELAAETWARAVRGVQAPEFDSGQPQPTGLKRPTEIRENQLDVGRSKLRGFSVRLARRRESKGLHASPEGRLVGAPCRAYGCQSQHERTGDLHPTLAFVHFDGVQNALRLDHLYVPRHARFEEMRRQRTQASSSCS